jgi:hypothetical protein
MPSVSNRAAWSAAGGVVLVCCASNAVVWIGAAAVPRSGLPGWPAAAFGVAAVAGLYGLIAPLVGLPPFRGFGSVAELLDACIREGRDARERILREPLDDWGIARETATWTLQTANRLHESFPAIADAFLLAAGDESRFSGQALAIQRVNAKLAVLINARTALG